ncbi:AAA family ATPase [Streptomyces anulatus]|uniref:AAA family ATPase n=1 Tax=Streptomyces anulatus TaxID=1892 RepID=UPI00387076B0|nr:AAA family ATPase [Streptomyces anulatus]
MDPHRHTAISSASDGGHARSSAGSSELSLLTYADLAEESKFAQARANSPQKRQAWGNLLALIEEIGGTGRIDEWDPTRGLSWDLVSLRIEGFQGATVPFSFQFDPTPGVTILHGPNGSGKSSISDGIRTALSGRSDWWAAVAPATARSGKSPLWEKVNCARDAEESTVEVVLTRGEESLRLTARIGKDGQVNRFDSIRQLSSEGVASFEIAETPWSYAVESHPPVFSYADVERRVQQHEDLQRYIENLLALGGCFDHLERRVEEISSSATASRKRLAAALKGAKERVARVDAHFLELEPQHHLPDMSWSGDVGDMRVWLTENGLTEVGAALPEVTAAGIERLDASLRDVDRALELVLGDVPTVHHRLAVHLTSLHSEVEQVANCGHICPVCDSEVSDWVQRLADNLASVTETAPRRNAANASLKALRGAVEIIPMVLDIVSGVADFDEPLLDGFRSEYAALLATFEAYGEQPVAPVVTGFLGIRAKLSGESWKGLYSKAIELSDISAQWRRGRRATLEPYIAAWEQENEEAESAPLWEATRKCIGELEDRLRAGRTVRFEGKAGVQVERLLKDAGIVLESVSLKRTRAEISVQGADGNKLELAMLSAGQRNAFLLAPLFATAGSGPFNFLILDDPVHSFDEIRVDRLAAVISDLAKGRRVIVLTHDERLKEHLLARSHVCEAWVVSRDGIRGEISVEKTDELWRVLIRDAESVWQFSPKVSTTGYLNEVQIIRGLLRQALDDALRQCVVRYSLFSGENVATSLGLLDGAMTTTKRLDAAKRIISLDPAHSHPVDKARQACGHHIAKWNSAAHGGEEAKADLKLEIKAGLDACSTLGEWDF